MGINGYRPNIVNTAMEQWDSGTSTWFIRDDGQFALL